MGAPPELSVLSGPRLLGLGTGSSLTFLSLDRAKAAKNGGYLSSFALLLNSSEDKLEN